jgi:hypothetical protein
MVKCLPQYSLEVDRLLMMKTVGIQQKRLYSNV